MKPFVLVNNSSTLQEMIDELSRARHVALDTESNSFFAYFERVCLIQISTCDNDYIIDPVVFKELEPLGQVLADPDIEKILHAASNDIIGLRRDFNFHCKNLFDTAVACKLLGYQHLGLANIMQEHFGIQLNKKWQRCDWGRRPLQQQQLDYARLDTHYLIPLRHHLAAGLTAEGLWDKAREACDKLCEQTQVERPFHPGGFIHIKGARSLDAVGKKVLRALYIYRDREAQRKDRAPFRILSNEILLRLARTRPNSFGDFSKTKGLPQPYKTGRKAQGLLDIIHRYQDNSGDLEAALMNENSATGSLNSE